MCLKLWNEGIPAVFFIAEQDSREEEENSVKKGRDG